MLAVRKTKHRIYERKKFLISVLNIPITSRELFSWVWIPEYNIALCVTRLTLFAEEFLESVRWFQGLLPYTQTNKKKINLPL